MQKKKKNLFSLYSTGLLSQVVIKYTVHSDEQFQRQHGNEI